MANPLRFSVLSAITWRVIAELFRRHSAAHPLSIQETHPGISVRGRLHVLLDRDSVELWSWPRVAFNLGGPSGTYEVSGDPVDYATAFLTRDPRDVIDEIGRALGLAAPKHLPAATNPTLAVRLIADTLERVALAPGALRATAALYSAHFGCRVPTWAAFAGVDVDSLNRQANSPPSGERDAFLELRHLFLIHETDSNGSGEGPLDDLNKQPAVLVDLRKAEALLIASDHSTTRLDIRAAYESNGRRLASAVEAVLKHLGRP